MQMVRYNSFLDPPKTIFISLILLLMSLHYQKRLGTSYKNEDKPRHGQSGY